MADVKDLINLPDDNIDMIAATSVLQQQAADIRTKTINWASYMQSQMISQEDYNAISALDTAKAAYLQKNSTQAVKTLLNLLSHVSKDQTIQYILVMIDDLLQEERSRVDFFHDYAKQHKECVWGPFLNLLNRQDGFIVNMSSRILAKLACWGHELMPKSDLNFYLQFLKDQLTVNAKAYIKDQATLARRVQTIVVHQHGHGHGKDQQSTKNNTNYSLNMAQQQQQLHQQQIAGERYREMSTEQANALVDGRLPIPVE